MAGLPGTGLGGIFYMLLVIWMGVRETWLLTRGTSSRAQRMEIARFGGLAVCIVSALWLEGWLLQEAFTWFPGLSPDEGAAGTYLTALAPALTAAPLFILAVLLGGIHVLRLRQRPARNAADVESALAEKERAVA
jgi:hypothetical protein